MKLLYVILYRATAMCVILTCTLAFVLLMRYFAQIVCSKQNHAWSQRSHDILAHCKTFIRFIGSWIVHIYSIFLIQYLLKNFSRLLESNFISLVFHYIRNWAFCFCFSYLFRLLLSIRLCLFRFHWRIKRRSRLLSIACRPNRFDAETPKKRIP